jgi:hypothetical protein
VLEGSFGKIVVGVIIDFTEIDELEIGDKVFPEDEENAISVGLSIRIDII